MAGTAIPCLANESSYQVPASVSYGPVTDLRPEAITKLDKHTLRASIVARNVTQGLPAARLADLDPEVRAALELTAFSERGGLAKTNDQTRSTQGLGGLTKDIFTARVPISDYEQLTNGNGQVESDPSNQSALLSASKVVHSRMPNQPAEESNDIASFRRDSEIRSSSPTFQGSIGGLSTGTKFLVTLNLQRLLAKSEASLNITNPTPRTADKKSPASIDLLATAANTISLFERRSETVNA